MVSITSSPMKEFNINRHIVAGPGSVRWSSGDAGGPNAYKNIGQEVAQNDENLCRETAAFCEKNGRLERSDERGIPSLVRVNLERQSGRRERRAILRRIIHVPQRIERGIDVGQFIGADDTGIDELQQIGDSKRPSPSSRSACVATLRR